MNNTLGSQLKARRLERGLSREQVAAVTGLKVDHLRRIENGYAPYPRTETVSKIASALGVRVVVSVVAESVSESGER